MPNKIKYALSLKSMGSLDKVPLAVKSQLEKFLRAQQDSNYASFLKAEEDIKRIQKALDTI